MWEFALRGKNLEDEHDSLSTADRRGTPGASALDRYPATHHRRKVSGLVLATEVAFREPLDNPLALRARHPPDYLRAAFAHPRRWNPLMSDANHARQFASSPCFMHELENDWEQVKAWRASAARA